MSPAPASAHDVPAVGFEGGQAGSPLPPSGKVRHAQTRAPSPRTQPQNVSSYRQTPVTSQLVPAVGAVPGHAVASATASDEVVSVVVASDGPASLDARSVAASLAPPVPAAPSVGDPPAPAL